MVQSLISPIFRVHKIHTSIIQTTLLVFVSLIPLTSSVSFNFTTFDQNKPDIRVKNDSFIASGILQLTKNQQDTQLTGSVGRAYYSQPIKLWDKNTKNVADFSTHFSFIIKQVDITNNYGDGLTFYIAPVNSSVPDESAGRNLGLVNTHNFNITSKNQFVAVEFDTYKNEFDPSSDHVGIDVNSIVSVATVNWNSSIKNASTANAWISYDSVRKNLSVFLTYADNPVFNGNSSLSYIIDLSTVLPEKVQIGFSASTGISTEIHNILSWEFNSSLKDIDDTVLPTPESGNGKGKSKGGLIAGVIAGIIVLVVGVAVIGCFVRRKKLGVDENDEIDFGMDDDDEEFDKGTGPKRFKYKELSTATNNFSEEGKLGQGGFGEVYLGLLRDSNTKIAVKKISSGSKQGRKEYASEVKIISRLRHRNLVQLLGWSHDRGELLLVYEFMLNGSLDYHLYGGNKISLQWPIRYKIAHGLASALLYLHEEWEQCVVHRDIKSSNVMLDSSFNAKLGDFGLARLVDHGLGSQTTVLAGTMGYLAPECVITGKASKESDVYSFGVVALEIACGRRPVESREAPDKVRMVEWVWSMYGKGLLLHAVDNRLGEEFDMVQMECLMVVGLWCCHPDYTQRPTIRQALNTLNQDSILPTLPSKLPVPTYCAPPLNTDISFTTYSSSGFTGSTNSTTNFSSQSVISGTAPLLSLRADV